MFAIFVSAGTKEYLEKLDQQRFREELRGS